METKKRAKPVDEDETTTVANPLDGGNAAPHAPFANRAEDIRPTTAANPLDAKTAAPPAPFANRAHDVMPTTAANPLDAETAAPPAPFANHAEDAPPLNPLNKANADIADSPSRAALQPPPRPFESLRLYAHSIRMLARGQLAYRSAFWMQIVAYLAMAGGEVLGTVLLFSRFDELAGWTRDEALLFVGMMYIAFNAVEMLARGVTNFSPLVRGGAFDRMMLRPRRLLLQVLCGDVGMRRLVGVLLGAGIFAACIHALELRFGVVELLLFLDALVGGMALFLGLFLIEAILCLRTVQSLEFVNILTYGGRTSCQYPATIYREPVRYFFYIVPYALTLHVPTSYLAGKPMIDSLPLTFLAPAAGLVFLGAMLAWWRVAVRRYQSTGS